jgi:hypothetical protein
VFDRIERPLSEILLWLESKKLFVSKIVPPSNCFTATSSSAKSDNKGVRSKSEEEVEVEKMKEEEERMEKEMRGEEEVKIEEEKTEEERKEGDIHSVSHLINLIDRTRTTTEDIITERESEISRQTTLRTMLLQQSALDADLRVVTDMQTNTQQTVCIVLHITLRLYNFQIWLLRFTFFSFLLSRLPTLFFVVQHSLINQ